MSLCIRTGAQTGVDIGAALAALDVGLELGGFMPSDGRNEAGDIPERVAIHLRRHTSTDPAARTRTNVATADGALVIVRDRRRAGETRGTALTIGLCERRHRRSGDFPLLVVDPTWDPCTVGYFVRRWLNGSRLPLKLLVAGPRASLWPEGEETARRFVTALGAAR